MTTRAKICGLTRLEDARHAVDHGAWALGLILWPGSKRAVSLDAAAEISARLRREAEIVGVFVDAPLDEVEATADAVRLSMIQLHGDEGPAYCTEIARRTGARVIKALRLRTGADLDRAETFRTDFHLLDTYVEGVPGGTGRTFDWDVLRARRSEVPRIVSGGLTPDNVAAAIEATRPYAVDVASGVEAQPGIKDPEKVEAFLRAAGARPKPGPPRPVPVPEARA
jgi:phosphoribosylanthranilate isomerase